MIRSMVSRRSAGRSTMARVRSVVAGLENKNTEEAKREAVEHLEKSLEITTKVMGDVSYVTVSGLQSLGHLYIKEHETV